MKLEKLPGRFTICKLSSPAGIRPDAGFWFAGKTDQEVSLVCETASVPENTLAREDGWRGFRVEGTLDFSLTGILSGLSTVLAENGIGIFAVSTWNTDYIFVKEDNFEKAAASLEAAGHVFTEQARHSGKADV